jgi:hypothetical protein
MRKRGASKTLMAAYTAIEGQIEQLVDQKDGKGSYSRVLKRLQSWHALRWFEPFLENGDISVLPDPMTREEHIVEAFAPLVTEPSVALVSGVCILPSALSISSIIAAPSALRDIGCELFGYKVAGESIQSTRGLSKVKTFVCVDKLAVESIAGGSIMDFFLPLAESMKPGSVVLFADRLAYQDDVVECLVALDFEIEVLDSNGNLDLVMVKAFR